MQVSYVKLWIRLVEKKMSKPELRKQARLSASTMTKMNKGEPISMAILLRICDVLECNIGDIMDVEKPEEG